MVETSFPTAYKFSRPNPDGIGFILDKSRKTIWFDLLVIDKDVDLNNEIYIDQETKKRCLDIKWKDGKDYITGRAVVSEIYSKKGETFIDIEYASLDEAFY